MNTSMDNRKHSFTGDKDLDDFILPNCDRDKGKKADRMIRSESARHRREDVRVIQDKRVRKE